MLSPKATNFVAVRRGGVDGVSGWTGPRLPPAVRQAASNVIAAKIRRRSVFKTLSDDVKERVGNSRITGFRRMQVILPDQFARHADKCLIEIDKRCALARCHGANLVVGRHDVVGPEAAT